MCACACVFIHIYMCIYICMCIYVYMDKHIYIFIYILRHMAFRSDLIFRLEISSWIRVIDGTEETFNKL